MSHRINTSLLAALQADLLLSNFLLPFGGNVFHYKCYNTVTVLMSSNVSDSSDSLSVHVTQKYQCFLII